MIAANNAHRNRVFAGLLIIKKNFSWKS